MDGPPPDPRQVLAAVGPHDDPLAWALCLGLGLALCLAVAARRLPLNLRALLGFVGLALLLTAPLGGHLTDTVYGAWPTIDKEGSFLFYEDGVHIRALLHPIASIDDPAVRLIGVHLGHLWLIQALDLFTTTHGAFNLMALLSPALAAFTAFLLLHDLSEDPRVAAPLATAWGFGLHLFRDLNWYTIEKAGVFWLSLHAWALHRAFQRGGPYPYLAALTFGLMSWNNLYFGLAGGLLSAAALLATLRPSTSRSPSVQALLRANAASLAFALPLFALQRALMVNGPNLGDPDRFLWERAALDAFTLIPLRWNRMELWAACSPLPFLVGLLGLGALRKDARLRFAALAAAGFFALSLGPQLLPGPVRNPVYFAAQAVIPGLWRMAKPESLFHSAWLLLLAIAALTLRRWSVSARALFVLQALVIASFLLLVRRHPSFPTFTQPVQSALDPHWAERALGSPG